MDQNGNRQAGAPGNEMAGAAGQVVQARDITGDVNVHYTGPPPFPPLRQLPPAAAHFTGRDVELSRLDALLGSETQRPPTVAVMVITGTAGIGKTSLAVRWAHSAQDRFPDGQLYVNLRGFDPNPPVTAQQALGFCLRALGVPDERLPQDLDAMAGMYRSALAGRRVLVVLDNAATPEQVRPLLPSDSSCAVLVTSRSRMSGLVARDGAHRITLDVLTPAEAASLLRDIIGHDRTDTEPDTTAQLARQCVYLPLALRVAAERAVVRPHLSIGDLVKELTVEHKCLDVLTADDDEATAIRTVFSWSYSALPPDAARVFRLLAANPGPDISLDAVAALTGATPADTRQPVDMLVGVHLLAASGPDRFQLHDLLHAYAAERAAIDESDTQRDAATRRLFVWYLHTAHAALFAFYPQHPDIPIDRVSPECQPLSFADRDRARTWFAKEHANLMAVIRRAPAAGQHTVGWQLPNAVDCYLGDYYHVADRIAVHQLGLAIVQELDHQLGQRWAYVHLGEALQHARRYDEAIVAHQRGLEVARNADDAFGVACALGDLASSYIKLGRYQEAVDHSQQALSIYRALGHERNEGISLLHLGNAFRGMGELDQALVHLHRGLDIFNKIGALGLQATSLWSLGGVYHQQAKNEDAVNHLKLAAALNRKQHMDHNHAETLTDLGTILMEMGQPRAASEAWHEAIALLTDLDPDQATRVQDLLDALDPGKRTEHI